MLEVRVLSGEPNLNQFQRRDAVKWPNGFRCKRKEDSTVKRYWPAVLCALSMLGWITMEARAQEQDAEAHVAAAKAALSPKTENPKPWQTFDVLVPDGVHSAEKRCAAP